MIPNFVICNETVIMITLFVCGCLVFASVFMPQARQHLKRIKLKECKKETQDKEQEVQIIVVPNDNVSLEKSMAVYKRQFVVNRREPRNKRLVDIRLRYYKQILRIVELVGEDEVSVFSYLDNVLKHHFETYHNEISAHYRNHDDDCLLP